LKFPRYCSVGSSIRPLGVHSFRPSVAKNCFRPLDVLSLVRQSPRTDSIQTLTHFEAWKCSLLSIGRPELSRKDLLYYFFFYRRSGESGLESSALPWVIRLGFFVGLYNSPPSRRPSVAVQSLWFH
jgi:hypothetical protein